MWIQCINDEYKEKEDLSNINNEYRTLELDKVYLVFGISFIEREIYFDILSNHSDYPKAYNNSNFRILDERISNLFNLGRIKSGDEKYYPFLSFPEWCRNDHFYKKLVDGEIREKKIFDWYNKTLFLEFRHPDISEFALEVSNNWVQCPNCTYAWEIKNFFEMSICESCKKILLNPYVKHGIDKSFLVKGEK